MKKIIRQRRTLKVLGEEKSPWPPASVEADKHLSELLQLGGCAPYHYACHPDHQRQQLDSPAPWRFYALRSDSCRRLLESLLKTEEKLGKIGRMLAVSDGLVIATWLPDPPGHDRYQGFQSFEPSKRNMEHIAAASAAIQNMLLAATDNGNPTYWSSGGVLRTETIYNQLMIPLDQVLLGAIFVFPQETKDAETVTGSHREKTGNSDSWSRWLEP